MKGVVDVCDPTEEVSSEQAVNMATDEGTEMDQSEEQDSSKKEARKRKRQLYQQIRDQIEFYFGAANLARDRFLNQLVKQDPNIDISIFLKFNKIKHLTSDAMDIAKALQSSTLVGVSEDKTKVFRKEPLEEYGNRDDCIVYVENIPPEVDHDWIKGVFSEFGKVVYVSLPRYAATKKIKGFAFVEFDTAEEANRTLEAFGSAGCRLSENMDPACLRSIVAFEGESQKPSASVGASKEVKGEKLKESQEDVEDMADDDEAQPKAKKKKLKEKEAKVKKETSEQEPKMSRKKLSVDAQSQQEDDDEHNLVRRKRKLEKSEPKVKKRKMEQLEPEVKEQKSEESMELQERVSESDQAETADSSAEGDNKIESEKDDSEKKKRKRSRQRKAKRKKEDEKEDIGLQVLSKLEWKRIRNKYLNLQRTAMQSLKRTLRQAQEYERNRRSHGPTSQEMQCDTDIHGAGDKRKGGGTVHRDVYGHKNYNAKMAEISAVFEYKPDVIVHFGLDSPTTDVKELIASVRAEGNVEHVEFPSPHYEGYIRCSSAEAAAKLVSKNLWPHAEILKGQDDINYWYKMVKDREARLSKKKPNVRGRAKLLQKAEKVLGKRIKI